MPLTAAGASLVAVGVLRVSRQGVVRKSSQGLGGGVPRLVALGPGRGCCGELWRTRGSSERRWPRGSWKRRWP